MEGTVKMKKTVLNLPGENDFFTQEAYKALRTNIQFCGQDVRVILVTSSRENEGKTTVTLQTGKSFAELGKKVLVIDADMRKSVMAGRNTDASSPAGLSEAITGIAPLKECIYATQYPGMQMIFSGKYPPNPVELLGGRYFKTLLDSTKKIYDYIFIDTPPLGSVIDAAVIAPLCDGAILVISNQLVRRSQAAEVISQLQKADCKVLGIVRNNTKKNDNAYYKKKYY